MRLCTHIISAVAQQTLWNNDLNSDPSVGWNNNSSCHSINCQHELNIDASIDTRVSFGSERHARIISILLFIFYGFQWQTSSSSACACSEKICLLMNPRRRGQEHIPTARQRGGSNTSKTLINLETTNVNLNKSNTLFNISIKQLGKGKTQNTSSVTGNSQNESSRNQNLISTQGNENFSETQSRNTCILKKKKKKNK